MNHIKTVKRLAIYLICFGALMLFVCIGTSAEDPDAVTGGVMFFILVGGPGIWITILANKMKNELPGLIRKCPYCAEVINKDAVICRYCKKDLK